MLHEEYKSQQVAEYCCGNNAVQLTKTISVMVPAAMVASVHHHTEQHPHHKNTDHENKKDHLAIYTSLDESLHSFIVYARRFKSGIHVLNFLRIFQVISILAKIKPQSMYIMMVIKSIEITIFRLFYRENACYDSSAPPT